MEKASVDILKRADPPITDALCALIEKHPRIMGVVMGVMMHPILTTILLGR